LRERKFDQAEAALWEAIDVLERLVAQAPSTVSYQESLRNAYNFLGNCLYEQDDPQAALGYLQKAIDVQTSIAQKNPDLPEAIDTQSGLVNNLGLLHRELGNLEAAMETLNRALALKEPLARRFPDVADFRGDIATIHVNRAKCFAAAKDWDKAITAYEAAEGEWRQLIERDPARWNERNDLAEALLAAADVHMQAENKDEARRCLEDAIAGLSSLVEDSNDAAFRSNLARAYHTFGTLEHEEGNLVAARECFARAAELGAVAPADRAE
jgi:tetratricopeptide (TPR) repeat protein